MALLLVVGLLPTVVVWPEQTATHMPSRAYADWLRAQVRTEIAGADRDAFEAALATASEERARSLQAFLRHFAAAYAQQAGGPSLAELFGVAEGAHEQVIDEIQRRLAQVSRWAVVPRFTTALHGFSFSSSRSLELAAAFPVPVGFAIAQTSVAHRVYRALGPTLLRALSSSRPRAP